jgi:hypothetical protein
VHATADATGVALDGAAAVHAGPATLRLSVPSPSRARTLTVLRLADGADPDAVASLDTGGLTDVRELERSADLVSGATVRTGAGFRSTIEVRAGRYVVVDQSSDTRAHATFTVSGAAAQAAAPAPTARLRMTDHAFVLPRRLDPIGVLRVANAGTRPHHVLGIRVSGRVDDRAALRMARNGGDLNAIGTPQDVLGLVSPGTANLVRYRLKPGRWVLVSYYGTLLPGAHPDAGRGLVTLVRVH